MLRCHQNDSLMVTYVISSNALGVTVYCLFVNILSSRLLFADTLEGKVIVGYNLELAIRPKHFLCREPQKRFFLRSML